MVPKAYTYDKYPIDPDSVKIVSESDSLQWTTCSPVDVCDERFSALPTKHIQSYAKSFHYLRLTKELKEVVDAILASRCQYDSTAAAISLELKNSVVDFTRRAESMEELRAKIPADGLLELMKTVILTGRFPDGSECKSKDRISLMQKLFDKSLPDAKSLDAEMMSERAMRNRVAEKATRADEIRKLSKEELMKRLIELETEE